MPESTLWTELTLENRVRARARVDVDPVNYSPLVLKISADTEGLAAKTAYFLATSTSGGIGLQSDGPWRSPE